MKKKKQAEILKEIEKQNSHVKYGNIEKAKKKFERKAYAVKKRE